MWLVRHLLILGSVLGTLQTSEKPIKKKATSSNLKRAIDSYSYPTPDVKYDEKSSNVKTKVIVETIKSISPPEYLPPSSGFLASSIDPNVSGLEAPLASVTYNAFEPDSAKKATQQDASPTATAATATATSTSAAVHAKKRPGGLGSYKYYGGSGNVVSSSASTSLPASTLSPAPVRTSAESTTTLAPGYQYTSRDSSTEKPVKIGGKVKLNGYNYQRPKNGKKPTRLDPKPADSKPEETNFSGYHYDVGSSGYEAPVKHAAPQAGMMGLSFMRSSSPYYNYHVMLD